jgi:hypothetical protein
MTTLELHYLSAREAREPFLSRRLSPVELMEGRTWRGDTPLLLRRD